jgi:hypothetical protein
MITVRAPVFVHHETQQVAQGIDPRAAAQALRVRPCLIATAVATIATVVFVAVGDYAIIIASTIAAGARAIACISVVFWR